MSNPSIPAVLRILAQECENEANFFQAEAKKPNIPLTAELHRLQVSVLFNSLASVLLRAANTVEQG